MGQYSIVNMPPKTITARVIAGGINTIDTWNYPNPQGELWWSEGGSPRFYTWEVDITMDTPTQHGSIVTQTPRIYNCLDIDVDDWIASDTGNVWRIKSILMKTHNTAKIIVEDWNRYNTFRSYQGNGTILIGSHVIFQTNEIGEPLFADLESSFATARFYAKVDSYFKYLNPTRNITVEQIAHNYKVGDRVSILDDGKYYLTNDDNISTFVGVVTQIISTRHFMLDPVTRITQLQAAYGHSVGTKLYYKGDILTDERGSKLMYIVTAPAIPSSTIGNKSNPVVNDNSKFYINDYEVTAMMTDTVGSIVDFINDDPTQDLYTASKVGSPTIIEGRLNHVYGVVGGFVPFKASINGVELSFTDSTSGMVRYGIPVADENDIIKVINAASIPNIVATTTGMFIKLENTSGGSINITTVQPDTNGSPFMGNNSITGLPANTAASIDTAISITRLDGGELRFSNHPSMDNDIVNILGLSTSRSGRYPQALTVEQGIRKGDTYIVEDMIQRDTLNVLIGDSAFVIDTGNGEWSTWFYTTTGWVLTATQDSARTDADVLSTTITHNDNGNILIGTVSNNSRVIDISIAVSEPFDGDVILNVGDSADNSRLISDDVIDLGNIGTYSANPSYVYKQGGDTDLIAYFDSSGSTKGVMKVIISYS